MDQRSSLAAAAAGPATPSAPNGYGQGAQPPAAGRPSRPQPSAQQSEESTPQRRRELSPDEEKWRKVCEGLRRTKFRRWVLGPILQNVDPPTPADGQITLRFKSRSNRDRFMAEMEDQRAQTALRSAIDREYGPGLALKTVSPHEEEEKAQTSAAAESPLVRAAMAMGAQVVTEEDVED